MMSVSEIKAIRKRLKGKNKFNFVHFDSIYFIQFYSVYCATKNFIVTSTTISLDTTRFVCLFCFVYFLINNLLRLKIDLKMCKMCIFVDICIHIHITTCRD